MVVLPSTAFVLTRSTQLCHDWNSRDVLAGYSASKGVADRRCGEMCLVHKDWSLSDLLVLGSSLSRQLKLRLRVKVLVSLATELGTDSTMLHLLNLSEPHFDCKRNFVKVSASLVRTSREQNVFLLSLSTLC